MRIREREIFSNTNLFCRIRKNQSLLVPNPKNVLERAEERRSTLEGVSESRTGRGETEAVSGTVPILLKSTIYYHKAPLAISRGGRSEVLGRSLCVIRVGIHQW